MAPQSENILLIVGFIVITLLSFIIEKKVSRQLSLNISVFTYAVIGLVCLYYLFDVIVHVPAFFQDKYFYFWLALLIVQICVFVWRLKNAGKLNEQNIDE